MLWNNECKILNRYTHHLDLSNVIDLLSYAITRTKDNYLEIKINDRNQVDDKIVCWLGRGFLSFH